MKYQVMVKDLTFGGVEVEANSVEEAKEKAKEKYYDGAVAWGDTELEFFVLDK